MSPLIIVVGEYDVKMTLIETFDHRINKGRCLIRLPVDGWIVFGDPNSDKVRV